MAQSTGKEGLQEESTILHQVDANSGARNLPSNENGGDEQCAIIPCKSMQEDACFVAPHPDLLKKLMAKFNQVKEQAAQELPIIRNLLRLIQPRSPGINDGLLHPTKTEHANSTTRTSPLRARLTGPINVAVVLIDFSDKQFSATQTPAHFRSMWFGTGVNSVNDFYKDASNSKVSITGAVVGPYRMPHSMAYYANGSHGMANSFPNARTMATDAANLAKADVAFAKYDNDKDGTVETLVIIHAGAGSEATGSQGDIWSHKWWMQTPVVDDGVTLGPYLTVPGDCKLGVCAHELGHLAFGWPDLYDYDMSSAGVGNWCLMAAGSYNGNQNNPSPPSAWCKVNQGWVTVNTVTTKGSHIVSLPDVKTGHSVLKLTETGAPSTEYWLLENRHKVGRDANLPGDGLLVWHVDDAMPNNSNEATHYKVALLQADGRMDLERNEDRGDGGDQFPGAANNRHVNSYTSPSSKAYSSSATMSFGLIDLSDPGPTMTMKITV